MVAQRHKAIFVDKDGTLIQDIAYNINVDLIEIEPEVVDGLKLLQKEGFLLIVISNQPGIAKGYFTEEDVKKVGEKISALLLPHHLKIEGFYYCPHHPEGNIKEYAVECECRKPLPGLILEAAANFNIDLTQSWMVGDILNDVEAGKRAGCRTVLIDNGNETQWVSNEWRTPDFTATNFREAALFITTNSGIPTVYHERVDRL